MMALALLPTAVLSLFALDQLGRATSRWFRPGVDRALESGVEVSKTALTRMETTALAFTEEWAQRTRASAGDPMRAAEALLEGSGVDVAQLYERHDGGWRMVDQREPSGVLLPERFDFSGDIESAITGSRVIRSPSGALAGLAPLGDERALVAAMWVPRTFFADLDSLGYTFGYYRQLGAVVGVQRRVLWVLVAIVGLLVVVLAYAVANMLAAQMSRPLTGMSEALERVAEGRLDVRVDPAGAREVQALATSFNAMTANLAEARTQLQEAEREAAWREVARRLAHEFKNILTPMSLSLHRLSRRVDAVAPEQREAVTESLGSLGRGVDHLTQLSDQFAQYARLPDPRFEPQDLTEISKTAARMHEDPDHTIDVHDGPALPVRADSLLLSRLIHNLVLNACEASPAGTHVELRTRRDGSRAILEVLDRGHGVSDDMRDRAFEPYVSSKKRGSGLGLSLVRDIARQHDGDVALEPRDGGGACARLALPLREDT